MVWPAWLGIHVIKWHTDKVHYLRIFLELYYVIISQALSVCFLNLYLFGFISVYQV